jgi:hypothetical protein
LRWPIEPALASFMRDFYAIVQRRAKPQSPACVFKRLGDLNVAAVRSSEVAQADIKDPPLSPSEGVPDRALPTYQYRSIPRSQRRPPMLPFMASFRMGIVLELRTPQYFKFAIAGG